MCKSDWLVWLSDWLVQARDITFFHEGQNYLRKMCIDLHFLPLPRQQVGKAPLQDQTALRPFPTGREGSLPREPLFFLRVGRVALPDAAPPTHPFLQDPLLLHWFGEQLPWLMARDHLGVTVPLATLASFDTAREATNRDGKDGGASAARPAHKRPETNPLQPATELVRVQNTLVTEAKQGECSSATLPQK